MPNDADLQDMLLFLWGKDLSGARRPPFDIAPCLLGTEINDYARAQTIFEGMLGYLRIAQRPELRIEGQPTGLMLRQNMVTVEGQYDQRSKCIILYMPPSLTNRDDVLQVVDTLAHEIAHHYLSSGNGELARQAADEVFTDVAAVWIGFGSPMVEARQKCVAVYKQVAMRACKGYVDHESLGRLEQLRGVLSQTPRPLSEWLRSNVPLKVPDYPIVARFEGDEAQTFYVDTIQGSFVSLCGKGGTARTLVRISYLRYLNGHAEPRSLANWAFIPPPQWDGLIVQFLDGSIGELETHGQDRIRFHQFRPSTTRVFETTILLQRAQQEVSSSEDTLPPTRRTN